MTAQYKEMLIYEGKLSAMAFCPLLPENDARIIKLNDDEIEDIDSMFFSTACWREYIGTWVIEGGKFYLLNIIGRYKITSDSPIFADWFSGVLRIVEGKKLLYVHMGFGTVYEKEIHIKISKGSVIKTETIDNRGKKFNEDELAENNLPGSENKFDGGENI